MLGGSGGLWGVLVRGYIVLGGSGGLWGGSGGLWGVLVPYIGAGEACQVFNMHAYGQVV